MEPQARFSFDAGLVLPNHALFVGATQSGKTRLCLHLLAHPHLFSPRPQRILFHYDQFQEAYLDIKQRLEAQGIQFLLYKGCTGIRLEEIEKLSGQTILLIDDFSEETSSSPAIARIATNGRHCNLSLWLVWHSLFSKHSASRIICQNVRYFFFLPSLRLESQLKTFGGQLGMRSALLWAFHQCQQEREPGAQPSQLAQHRYLLVDGGPATPTLLRLRYNIERSVQTCYT